MLIGFILFFGYKIKALIFFTILTVLTMAATKRIPVSEETWKELGKEKEPGQTWDELLQELLEYL